ncbi:hypothetical protein AB0J83_22175 [Actinoplanes sp. NPDC049596]|uniref:hypothetical protein n=1 Tax=unclassified Actinoplanes TaxID=2626549 RepID=UPI0034416803
MVTTPPTDESSLSPPDRDLPSASPQVIVPPFVYVPGAPQQAGDTELSVDLRQTREGQIAIARAITVW